jgi:hypothetical protein
MKRVLFLLCVFVFAGFAQEEDESILSKSIVFKYFKYFKVGVQANTFNSLKLISGDNQITLSPYNGLTATVEIGSKTPAEIAFGMGAGFQPSVKIRGVNKDLGTISSVTPYVFLEYPISIGKVLNPSFLVRFGYGFFSTSGELDRKKPGVYHAIGVSLPIYKGIQARVLFSNQYGDLKIGQDEYYMNYSSLNLGLLF